ncbi:DUF6538 domain-containing protein [Xanthobacteraceae bacterium A53D]
MASRHPKPVKDRHGTYYLRCRIPADLQAHFPKREVKFSLDTKDRREAQARFDIAYGQLVATWEGYRKEAPTRLDNRQISAIAGEVYDRLYNSFPNGDRSPMARRIAEAIAGKVILAFDDAIPNFKAHGNISAESHAQFEDLVCHELWPALHAKGAYGPCQPWWPLLAHAAEAMHMACLQILRECDGDFRPDPARARFADFGPPISTPSSPPPPASSPSRSPLDVFEAYAAESGKAGSTVRTWRGYMRRMSAIIPDVTDISDEKMIEWKNHCMKTRTPDSFTRGPLAAARAVFEFGVTNKMMRENFALRIRTFHTLRPTDDSDDGRAHDDVAARLILRASLEPQPKRYSAFKQAAIRWGPRLLCYTGARGGEIMQLRKRDFRMRYDVMMVYITPVAGTTKTMRPRWVPLHPALLSSGLIEWVDQQPDGPLFYAPPREGSATPGYELMRSELSRWTSAVLNYPNRKKGQPSSPGEEAFAAPNHGWRHRFINLAREFDLREDAQRYMTGHKKQSTDQRYGAYKAKVLFAQISKIPTLCLD